MLRLADINKSYSVGQSRLHVLKGIDLEIAEGEMVSIMGPSGSGKSTLLNVLGILDKYDSGEYHLAGTLIKDLSETEAAYYRNRLLGFVFQSFNLIPFKTAVENVALPLYYQKIGRRKRNRIALEYLDRVGIADWAGHLPGELSGGQQQRVAIARSLITKPKVMLADEPTGALDSQTSREVIEILRSINEKGTTVVVVTHEHEISEMTDRVIHLLDGVIGHEQNNGAGGNGAGAKDDPKVESNGALGSGVSAMAD
ncbi:MAG: ABC transporter ATP-binding protein [bacterium]|nr:ABC transporter ATP-binding protein [bacterium]